MLRKSGSLFSASMIYLLSALLNAAIPLALLPVLTRYLTPVEYGEVAMFQTLLGALGAFVGLNVVGAAGRKYFDVQSMGGDFKRHMGAYIQVTILSALCVFSLLFLVREQLSGWLNVDAEWILLAVLVSASSVVVQLRLGQWQVQGDARFYGYLQISQGALNMLLSLLMVVVFLRGADGRIEAQIYAACVFALLALFLLCRDGLLGALSWQPKYLKEALHFGVPLIPHVAGAFLLAAADRFVINAELGLADAGMYMVAAQLTAAIGLIFDAINKAYVPWLFARLKRDDESEKKKIVGYTYMWFLVIGVAVAVAFLVGPSLVVLVAGSEYSKAGDVVGWLALGQGFFGMYLMVTNYIFFSGKTIMLSVATISSGLLNVVLLMMFVKVLGLKGAAVAFSMAMAVRFLLTWWVAQKCHRMPWFDFCVKV